MGVLRLREDRKRGKFGLVGREGQRIGEVYWGSRWSLVDWVENAGVLYLLSHYTSVLLRTKSNMMSSACGLTTTAETLSSAWHSRSLRQDEELTRVLPGYYKTDFLKEIRTS